MFVWHRRDPLKIGVLQALTGDVASIGKGQIRGIELALDDLDGKVAGHAVLLRIENTELHRRRRCQCGIENSGRSRPHRHTGNHLLRCSRRPLVSKAMSEAGLTMISGNNSASFLTACFRPGKVHAGNRGISGPPPMKRMQERRAAVYAFNILNIRKAAVMNDGEYLYPESHRKFYENVSGIRWKK